jgi:hypothetical protein
MWTPILYSLFLVALLTGLHHHRSGQPRVRLGGTTLAGKRLQPSNLEFFGGLVVPSHHVSIFLNPSFSGIPFAEPPVDGLRFSPPRLKHSLSPLRSFDARNYGEPCLQPVSSISSSLPRMGTYSPFHSNGVRRRRKIASRSTYSDLPVWV